MTASFDNNQKGRQGNKDTNSYNKQAYRTNYNNQSYNYSSQKNYNHQYNANNPYNNQKRSNPYYIKPGFTQNDFDKSKYNFETINKNTKSQKNFDDKNIRTIYDKNKNVHFKNHRINQNTNSKSENKINNTNQNYKQESNPKPYIPYIESVKRKCAKDYISSTVKKIGTKSYNALHKISDIKENYKNKQKYKLKASNERYYRNKAHIYEKSEQNNSTIPISNDYIEKLKPDNQNIINKIQSDAYSSIEQIQKTNRRRSVSQNTIRSIEYNTKANNKAPQEKKKEKFSISKIFKSYSKAQIAILATCAIVFTISAGTLVNYFYNSYKQDKALKEAESLYMASSEETANIEPTVTPAPNNNSYMVAKQHRKKVKATPIPTVTPEVPARTFTKAYANNPLGRIREKFFPLLDMNEDIVGWLNIGNVVNQPVVKKDNEFYLTHNYKKEENPAGSIFLDEDIDIRTQPENLICHGHNMKNGSMFGKLVHYKKEKGIKFFLDNAFIKFDSLYEESEYVIFGVFEVETNYNSPLYFPFMSYYTFDTDHAADRFISDVKSRSLYSVPIDLKATDSFITLATCTLNSDTTRLLVIGRKLRPSEDKKELQNQLFYTTRVR